MRRTVCFHSSGIFSSDRFANTKVSIGTFCQRRLSISGIAVVEAKFSDEVGRFASELLELRAFLSISSWGRDGEAIQDCDDEFINPS